MAWLRRISNEDGVNAGERNIGRLFLFAVPAVLGVAALIWLSFYIDAHAFNRQLSQEARSNEAVGAAPLPKAKIQIEIANKRTSCRVVDKAYIDGEDLWVYWHKVCNDNYGIEADHIMWQGLSPDGTVIVSGDSSTANIDPGQRGEFHTDEFHADPRISTVRVRAAWNGNWNGGD